MKTLERKNLKNLPDYQKRYKIIDEIIRHYEYKRSNLISVLQKVQQEYKYLPADVLDYIANTMEISPSVIHGVATFYSQFSLTPKGKYEIKVCDGTACHVRKSAPVIKAIKEKLNLTDGKTTTDDFKFSFETVNCLGACGLAPVVVINEKIYSLMTPEVIKTIIDELKSQEI